MNYRKVYFQLVEDAKAHPHIGYTETHHIVPRSEGGSDDKDNLVDLSGRQHYIAHLLLAKIYNDYKMYCAVACMKRGRKFKFNSRLYELLKTKRSKMMSEAMKGNSNGLGYKFTFEQRQKASDRLKGSGNPFFGHKHTEDTKKKISDKCKGHKYNGGGFCSSDTVWWNNGIVNKRAKTPPSPEWKRGRLKRKS